MQRTQAFILASLALLLSCASALSAADPGAIGLGLDGLHMHMTMAEARRAYPALIDRKPDKLSLRDYALGGCKFSVELFFVDNALASIDLETQEPYGFKFGIEVCKPAILSQLAEQYGTPMPPPGNYPEIRYFRSNDVMTIFVNEEIGYACGLHHDSDRHLFIFFSAQTPSVVRIC